MAGIGIARIKKGPGADAIETIAKVVHELDGPDDRIVESRRIEVALDFRLAIEVRNTRTVICPGNRGIDEMLYAGFLGCVDELLAVPHFCAIAMLPEICHGEDTVDAGHSGSQGVGIVKVSTHHLDTALGHGAARLRSRIAAEAAYRIAAAQKFAGHGATLSTGNSGNEYQLHLIVFRSAAGGVSASREERNDTQKKEFFHGKIQMIIFESRRL